MTKIEKPKVIEDKIHVDITSKEEYSDSSFTEEDIESQWKRMNIGLFKIDTNFYNCDT